MTEQISQGFNYTNAGVPLDTHTFDVPFYTREQWEAATVDTDIDCLKRGEIFTTAIANTLLRYGNMKNVFRVLHCGPKWVYLYVHRIDFLYFFRHGDLVKIGYTGGLLERVRFYRYMCPGAMFAAVVRGTKAEERALHVLLAAYRVHGEWFTPAALDVLVNFSPEEKLTKKEEAY